MTSGSRKGAAVVTPLLGLNRGIRARVDAEEYGIEEFVRYAGSVVKSADLVLDAGAGTCPYRANFEHARYESCDIEQNSSGTHTFLCDVQSVPRPDNYYDGVISTQVLDDVPYPQRVVDECFRILKPGGSLFLTAPQGWGIHNPPHHYFGFTSYGLKLLFENAGFDIRFIRPRGGIFWYLGKRVRALPTYIARQYSPANLNEGTPAARIQGRTRSVIRLLCWLSYLPCRFMIPLTCFYLDRLDRQQGYTLGYACHCIKTVPERGNPQARG